MESFINDLTLLIIVKNGAKYVKETCDSINSQLYHPEHIIVVDGGSTDNTVELIIDSLPTASIILNHSERDIVDSYILGYSSVITKYVTSICVSDSYLNKRWLMLATKALIDTNLDLVWGLVINKDESNLSELLPWPILSLSPNIYQKYPHIHWLVTGFAQPENNYIIKTEIIKNAFADLSLYSLNSWQRTVPHLYAILYYHLHRIGILFLPIYANYGLTHKGQRQSIYSDSETKATLSYQRVRKKIMFKSLLRWIIKLPSNPILSLKCFLIITYFLALCMPGLNLLIAFFSSKIIRKSSLILTKPSSVDYHA